MKQGKMPELVYQEHNEPLELSMPRYWVHISHLPSNLSKKRKGFLAFRDITNSTNLRTAVFCVLPVVPCGDTLHAVVLESEHTGSMLSLVSCVSSFIFDYVARQKIGGSHMKFFNLKQLPVLPPNQYTSTCTWDNNVSIGDWIFLRALELTYTAWDLEPF